jgi:chromosome segregation ATPase
MGLGGSVSFCRSEACTLYNQITSEMMDLRKKHPDAQQKIYAMLDWTNKLYKAVNSNANQAELLKQKLAQKDQEISELKASVKAVKEQADKTKSTLASIKDEVTKQLDDAHTRSVLLERENKDLHAKLQALQVVTKEVDASTAGRKDLKA